MAWHVQRLTCLPVFRWEAGVAGRELTYLLSCGLSEPQRVSPLWNWTACKGAGIRQPPAMTQSRNYHQRLHGQARLRLCSKWWDGLGAILQRAAWFRILCRSRSSHKAVLQSKVVRILPKAAAGRPGGFCIVEHRAIWGRCPTVPTQTADQHWPDRSFRVWNPDFKRECSMTAVLAQPGWSVWWQKHRMQQVITQNAQDGTEKRFIWAVASMQKCHLLHSNAQPSTLSSIQTHTIAGWQNLWCTMHHGEGHLLPDKLAP